MFVYIIATAFSIGFSVLAVQCSNKKKMVYFHQGKIKIPYYFIFAVLSAVPLTLVSAFRYEVGTDYGGTYRDIFEQIVNGREIRDAGYGLLNKIVAYFSDDYAWALFLSSLMFGFFIFSCIYSQSKEPTLSILLYVITNIYFISMNMVRQSLATSIFLFAMKYIKEKKLIKYIICIMIASSFHPMALIYFPFYFINKIDKHMNKIGVVFVVLVIFQNTIRNIIPRLLIYSPFGRNFVWYYNSHYYTQEFNLWSFLVEVSILLLFLIGWKNRKKDSYYNLYFLLQMIGVFILAFSKIIPLAQRISWMFTFAKIIYIPECLQLISNKTSRKMIKWVMIIGFVIYMYITIIMRGYHDVLPYKSILNRE